LALSDDFRGILLSGLPGSIFIEIAQIPFLYSLAGPGRLAEKFQAGIDRRVEQKTADGDAVGQSRPTVSGDEGFENRLQVDAVKRIVGVGSQAGDYGCKFKVQSPGSLLMEGLSRGLLHIHLEISVMMVCSASPVATPLNLDLKPAGVFVTIRRTVIVVILNSRPDTLVFIQKSSERR